MMESNNHDQSYRIAQRSLKNNKMGTPLPNDSMQSNSIRHSSHKAGNIILTNSINGFSGSRGGEMKR